MQDARTPHLGPIDQRALTIDSVGLREWMASAAVPMAVTSTEGRFIYVNPPLAAMLGYDRRELEGRYFRDITHPDDVDASVEGLQALLTGRLTHFSQRKRYRTSTGEDLWIDLSVSSVIRDGAVAFLVAVMMNVSVDVMERSTWEEDVEWYRTIADHAGDLVLRTSGDGTIEWASSGAFLLLGVDPRALLGLSVLDVLAEGRSDSIREIIRDVRLGAPAPELLVHARGHGATIPLIAHGSPLASGGAMSGMVITLRVPRQPISLDESSLGRASAVDLPPFRPDAGPVIGSDAWLQSSLKEITSIGRQLVPADYGALQLSDGVGRPGLLVHDGVVDNDLMLLAQLPTTAQVHHAKGTTGGAEPRIPQASAMLMVPITDDGDTRGRLYFARTSPPFGPADRARATRLAELAGLVLRSSALARQAETLQTVLTLTGNVFLAAVRGASGYVAAQAMADGLPQIVPADLVLVAEVPESGAASAVLAQAIAPGSSFDLWRSPSTREPEVTFQRLTSSGRQVSGSGPIAAAGPLGGGLGGWAVTPVPGQRPAVVLVVARDPGSPVFTAAELHTLTILADRLGFALRHERQVRDSGSLLVQDERLRIARDLHDLTVQRIFAAGTVLDAALRTGGGAFVEASTVREVINDLNETIVELRAHVAALSTAGSTLAEREVVALIRRVASEFRAVRPRLTVALDDGANWNEATVSVVLAALREGISNAVSHGDPASIEASVTVDGPFVMLEVSDAGGPQEALGAESDWGGHGLANLRHRAEASGGGMEFGTADTGRTTLRWWVPRDGLDPHREGA